MKGITIAEECHVVNILPPIDLNGGKSSDVFSLEGYAHATIVVQIGVSGGAVPTLTIVECDNFTPSNTTAIAFKYWAETTSDGDTLATKVDATTSGVALSTNNNIFYVIEVDASQLTDGYPCLRAVFSDPSASVIGSAVAILSGARFASDPANRGTAIA